MGSVENVATRSFTNERVFAECGVENDKKAEIIADYFETNHWGVRPLSDVRVREPLGPMLNVKLDNISLEELQKASKKLKLRKACGVDEIPSEYWRIALEDGSHPLARWILEF